MPYALLKQSTSLAGIFTLPEEILEEIVSRLDQHKDLVALALTSRFCANLVIPRHTQYRILRLRHTFPEIWAHLARRSDLARNVRELYICERDNYGMPDRYPTTLIDNTLNTSWGYAEESARIRNICTALRSMNNLRVFSWSWADVPLFDRPTSHPQHENAVLSVVSRLPALEGLYLNGKFALHALNAIQDPKSLSYPLWRVGNLRYLTLSGDTWAKVGNSKHLCALLAKSPNLEYLEVPLEFYHLAECRLPNLKKLKLVMQSGVNMAINQSRALFLQNHPSIEELNWSPIGNPWIPPTSLPNLKSIVTNRQFIMALDATYGVDSSAGPFMNLLTPPATPSTPKGSSSFATEVLAESLPQAARILRQINSLDVMYLDARSLLDLKSLDRNCLTKLRLHILDDLSTLFEVADAFPNIEWLSLPPKHFPSDSVYPKPVSEVQWLVILPRFKKLQVFRGSGLWSSVKDLDSMHKLIMELTLRCPNLRELDHHVAPKRGAVKRILISRGENEFSNYRVVKPRPWYPFDVACGAFD